MIENKKAVVICIVRSSWLASSLSMTDLIHSIVGTIENGATCIIFLLQNCEETVRTFTLDFPELDSLFQTNLGIKEKTLLCFSQGINQASILSHRLRSLGFSTTSFTGFRAFQADTLDFRSPLADRLTIDILKRHICNLDAVIISGLQFIEQDGTLVTLSEEQGEKLLLRIAEENSFSIKSFPGILHREEKSCLAKREDNPVIPEIPIFLKSVKNPSLEKRKVITGIIIVTDMAEFFLDFRGEKESERIRLDLLQALACKKVSLDMINICYLYLNFIVPGRRLFMAEEITKRFHVPYSMRTGLVKLSLTGVAMKGMPGVMAKVYGSLEAAGVDILRSTDSHISISCLILEEDLPSAIEALISRFRLSSHDLIYENKVL
ncbi:MAG: ACT domain-containing protein [Candidatus Xenobiia bacterium LiM19]